MGALGCAQHASGSGSGSSGSGPVSPLSLYHNHREIKITGNVPPAYSLAITVDHAKMVKDMKARKDGNDVRVVFEDKDGNRSDIDRVVDPTSDWNLPGTLIWFRTLDAGTSGTYSLYYGNDSPEAVLARPDKVYDVWDNFDATLDPAWKLAKLGAADGKPEIKEGSLHLSGQSNDFGGTTDDGVLFHRSLSGDFQADAQIVGVGGSLGGAAKMGGLMVRQNADVDAAFAMLSITFGPPMMGGKDLPKERINMSRTKKADMANSTPLPVDDKFPQLVEVTRLANQVSTAYSDDGITWIAIGTPATLTGLADPVLVGIPFSNISSDYGYADIGWFRVVKRVAPPPTAALGSEK